MTDQKPDQRDEDKLQYHRAVDDANCMNDKGKIPAPPKPAPDAMREATIRECINVKVLLLNMGTRSDDWIRGFDAGTNAFIDALEKLLVSAPVPSPDGAGELASFGHAPKPFWIIKFEDADRGEMHFGNEIDAHTTFEKASDNWNCTLFETARRKYAWRCGQLVLRFPSPAVAAEPVAWTPFRFVQVAFAQFKEPELRKIVEAISKQFGTPPSRGDRESLAQAYALHRWKANFDDLPIDMQDDCYNFSRSV